MKNFLQEEVVESKNSIFDEVLLLYALRNGGNNQISAAMINSEWIINDKSTDCIHISICMSLIT